MNKNPSVNASAISSPAKKSLKLKSSPFMVNLNVSSILYMLSLESAGLISASRSASSGLLPSSTLRVKKSLKDENPLAAAFL